MNSTALEVCYAAVTVVITGANHQYTGGLVGKAKSASSISRCYASGPVQATNTNYMSLQTGGLVGAAFNTTISNSYALGNVVADRTSGRGLMTGGLVGYFKAGAGEKIQYCFSGGTVSAQSAETGVWSGITETGGIVGLVKGSFTVGNVVDHCVVLGASVMARGDNSGPVPSYDTDIPPPVNKVSGTMSAWEIAWAANSMLVLGSDTYNAPYPAIIPAGSSSYMATAGDPATDAQLRDQSFWTGAAALYPNFSTSIWDFSNIYAKRHPVLKELRGQ
jgi:hypothetical protein